LCDLRFVGKPAIDCVATQPNSRFIKLMGTLPDLFYPLEFIILWIDSHGVTGLIRQDWVHFGFDLLA
jgi:hypothetical protein